MVPERLAREIVEMVPVDTRKLDLRADLAGLLVVSMAASYEMCVKESLITYASNQHEKFGYFADKHFEKMNSKIGMEDLHRYTNTFGAEIGESFKRILDQKKEGILNKTNVNIKDSYGQILRWRHAFAHSGFRNTTVEEAALTHIYAKRVLYCFDMAFNGP